MSTWKAAALAIAELGIGVFFAASVTRWVVGDTAPWFVLGACVLAALVRTVDIESWTIFTPGGLIGRAARAFGPRAATVTTAAVLIERLLLAALASVVIGQYAIGVGTIRIAGWRVTDRLTIQELSTVGASLLLGLLWLRARVGLDIASQVLARSVWIGIGLLALLLMAGTWTMAAAGVVPAGLFSWPVDASISNASPVAVGLDWLVALAVVLPILGGGEVLARTAHEFPPPRVPAVRRTARAAIAFTFVATALSSLLFVALVPARETAM